MNEMRTEIDSLLRTVLLSVNVPVERLRYRGKADAFITFQRIGGRDVSFADDVGHAYEHYYGADIYTKGDYSALLRSTEDALEAAGFYGISIKAEIYEDATEFYHIPIDFYFTEV